MTQTKLQLFNEEILNNLRRMPGNRYTYEYFWKELDCILKMTKNPRYWDRIPNDEVVLGEVWKQRIGEYYHKHTVHKFEYLYVESQGLVIDWHRHEEPANYGKQIRKIKEWYFFPDGTAAQCGKDEEHRLVNKYGKPIYVLSVKVGSNGDR